MDEVAVLALLVVGILLGGLVCGIVALVQIGALKRRVAALEEMARAAALRRQREREAARAGSPDLAPDAASDLVPDGAPDGAPVWAPDLAPDGTPVWAPDFDPDIDPDIGPDIGPDRAPGAMAAEPPLADAPPPLPKPDLVEAFRRNWLVWVAAVSLGFGGLFVVQYGIEQGLLGPLARVVGAVALGLGLIVGAERLRRGAATERLGVFHPAVALAAGGVATLFAAAMAAHLLYGLIGPLPGFAAMAAVGGVGVLLGLVYGPVLAGVGLIGAYLTPALIAGGEASGVLYGYILLVAAACYLVERLRRWIWLSAAASGLALVWAWGLSLALGADAALAAFALGLALAVTALPQYGLPPRADAPGGVVARTWPPYPALLANATVAGVGLVLLARVGMGVADAQTVFLTLTLLLALAVAGQRLAPVLDDIAPALVALALGAVAVASGIEGARGALPGPDWDLPAGPGPGPRGLILPWAVWTAALVGAIAFLGGTWRAAAGTRPMLWVLVAALAPIAAIVTLWTFWRDLIGLSGTGWGVVAAATACAPALVCGGLRRGAAPARAAAVFALGALGLLGLAAALALSDAPLTLALAVLALAAVELDRRFDLRLLARGAEAAAVLIGARLVVSPGLTWGVEAPLAQLALGYLAPAVVLGLAAWRTRRAPTRLGMETAAAAGGAIFLSLLGARGLGGAQTLESVALTTAVWGALALGQAVRARRTAEWARLRLALAAAYAAVAGVALVLALTDLNPLAGGIVRGPLLLDSLAFAYLVPAGLSLAAWRWRVVPRPRAALAGGIALAALYATYEIRRLWRGDVLSVPGVAEAELYTYTLALILAALVCIALGRGPGGADLRRAGLALAALTAAKVFLWDMAGLVGLARAGSFLALGLALAGIAWLHQRLDGGGKMPGDGDG